VKKQVPIWPIAAVAILIVALVGYFALVRPKRAEAGRLTEEIAALDAQLQAARQAAEPEDTPEKIKVADLFELAKAMPDRPDMPGIILELNSLAESVAIDFLSIAPEPVVAGTGYRILPVRFVFAGDYFALTDFLFRVRNLVRVEDGRLVASGRFFTLDFLRMEEGPENFPQIKAEILISAYVYEPGAQAATPATGAATATTTPATTTSGTTTAATEASAAGGSP
jgi:Tfp pilus assembly protein PilO